MSISYRVIIGSIFVAGLLIIAPVFAQEIDTDSVKVEASDNSGDNAVSEDSDSSTSEKDVENVDTGDNIEDSDSSDNVEDSENSNSGEDSTDESSDDLELDYAALGDMNPEEDLKSLNKTSGDSTNNPKENWTRRNLELFEVHGYFRVRPGLYHKFYIRNDNSLFPFNADREAGCSDKDKCRTQAGADMRFMFAPTINLSEDVRVHSEMMFFDNMIMGSSPSYYVDPDAATTATGAMLGTTQGDPGSDFFTMRRVWGEMESPFGQLRFGRMPEHWGTGMLLNSGDGIDDDFGDSVDRISFAFKLNGWMIMPAFDFPNEGLSLTSAAGRPFDVSQVDEAYRIVGVVAYQHEKEDQLAMLKRGDWLINTGLHFAYRAQAMEFKWTAPSDPDYNQDIDNQITTYKRDMWGLTPDLWFNFLYDTFHLEAELAFQFGHLSKPSASTVDMKDLNILAWSAVLQADYGLLSNQLRLGFEFGIASGDRDVQGMKAPASFDQTNSNSSKFTRSSFNPGYNVDLILFHHILGTVSGAYYFKPWLRYDFLKSPLGKNLGVQLDVLYSRAYYQASTISDSSNNLGLEIDARVDFATSDNFRASIKYGVLFPMSAFKGTYNWVDENGADQSFKDTDLSIPQTLQLLMAITF